MLPSFASIAFAIIPLAAAVDPLVNLGYASYHGTRLNNGVTQWMGMPYAAPPIGKNRFAAPQDLTIADQEYEADTHGPACMGVDTDPSDSSYSEDCLKLDVYAPSNATPSSRFPVFFYIIGGGFSGSSAPPNGTKLIETSDHAMVVVTLTYRVGPYGFLGGQVDGLSSNNGLKDQQTALQWTKKHIKQFGGNPDHIVLGGASAGGGSVVLQMANLDNAGYFIGVAAESAAFPAMLTPSEGQFMFNSVSKQAGCSKAKDQLSCLRDMDSKALQKKLQGFTVPSPGASGKAVYMYSPILDGDFVTDYPYRTFQQGKFNKMPAIFGDDTYEGNVFMPSNIDSLDEADDFIKDQFPRISSENFDHIHEDPYYKEKLDQKNYWGFADRLYGDLRYICPNLFLPWAFSTKADIDAVWNYRWNIGTAYHTSESNSVWQGGSDPSPANSIHHFWVSFIKHLDPNNDKAASAPLWVPSGKNDRYRHNRMLFDVHPHSRMEKVSKEQWNACVYLRDEGVSLGQ
ncbi:alpha/beta-hydrolase [Saccharata proteae CBS 121410]|uniref:Carboxylic ester hydrolase n=1 Tax=Saccharata proteae CBS 121410 TaxID=1314787 RepID=A0A9P4HRY9_9PEZI|nr:alpha/beta-hydrolase [Saccharata proteae CBS 121410]